MFDPNQVREAVKRIQAANPHLTFQTAWQKLQAEQPQLFESETSHPKATAKHSLSQAIMKLATLPVPPKFVQAAHGETRLVHGNDFEWSHR